MTTAYTNTGWASGNDAEWRAWVTEFFDMIEDVGLVYVPTTGDLADISTTSRPATTTTYYHRIYRFADALQATAPLFIKFEVGTGAAVANAGVRVSVGTDVTSAGVLQGGRVSTSVAWNRVPSGAGSPQVSRAAAGEGYFWIGFKLAPSNVQIGLGLFRTFDGTGNPTAAGYAKYYPNSASPFQMLTQLCIFDGPVQSAVGATSSAFTCFLPSGYGSSVVGTDVQFWKHYQATPRVRCNPCVLTTYIIDTPEGTERSMLVAGSLVRNYMSVGYVMGGSAGANAGANHTLMLIWE
jgi:hypothetical protein